MAQVQTFDEIDNGDKLAKKHEMNLLTGIKCLLPGSYLLALVDIPEDRLQNDSDVYSGGQLVGRIAHVERTSTEEGLTRVHIDITERVDFNE